MFFSFDIFEIDSDTTIAQFNQFYIFKQYFIYIYEQKLKNDAFEKMNKIIDVSIDAIYVRKNFYEFQLKKSNERKKQLKKN